VSGSGNVAQYTVEKLLDLGARPVTLSDSAGYIYDEAGIDRDKLKFVMTLKNVRRGRIEEYAAAHKTATYIPIKPGLDHNPLWAHKAQCAFPCATQNEIGGKDATNLLRGGVYVVAEGANMPTNPDGVGQFGHAGILYGPGKAANAGGVADLRPRDGAEQHALQLAAPGGRRSAARVIMSIHKACVATADRFGVPGNFT
jgi:glutamate dehydrogenase (NADP+)